MNEATVNNRKSLKERAKEFSVQLPFMEGREKGDAESLISQVITIRDYGFLKGDDGRDYAVFITDEYSKFFFFAGAVLTDQLQQLEADGYRTEIMEEGLPTLLTKKLSKNKRSYVAVEFYPE